MQSNKLKAHAAVLSANFFFGAAVSAVKHLSPAVMAPYAINGVRVLTALPLFWLLYAIKPGRAGIDRSDIVRFIGCALSGVVVNQLFFIKGVSLTSPIHASLLALTTPVMITILAIWILREKLTLNKTLGLTLGISGAVVLILSKDLSGSASNQLLGDSFIIVNAIAYSFYLVWVRPLMLRYSPVHVIRWVFTFGTVMMLPFCWQPMMATDWSAFNNTHHFALAFAALGATFFAYLFNVYGIAILGSSVVGAYIYTQPVFATIVAMVLMGEQLSLIKLLAAGLIFAGVYFVNRKPVSDRLGVVEE